MDGKERARIEKERGERERKREKMSDAFGEGSVTTRSPTVKKISK
jgi:hypothetical protein